MNHSHPYGSDPPVIRVRWDGRRSCVVGARGPRRRARRRCPRRRRAGPGPSGAQQRSARLRTAQSGLAALGWWRRQGEPGRAAAGRPRRRASPSRTWLRRSIWARSGRCSPARRAKWRETGKTGEGGTSSERETEEGASSNRLWAYTGKTLFSPTASKICSRRKSTTTCMNICKIEHPKSKNSYKKINYAINKRI
jgi:hypothetical protein